MLEIKNINYTVPNGKEILKNISLKFESGKISVVTGANGSGKSTLIKILMGITTPNSGSIFYNGKDITNLDSTERANLGFSLAMQQPVSFKGITVKKLMQIAGKENIGDICSFLSKVGLCAKDYVGRNFNNELSGGEMKRIELALALAKGGDVFLFDEPEAGIDIWSFETLTDIFKSLKGKTVVIVSHQQKILDLADNIIVFDACGGASCGPRKKMLPTLGKTQKCQILGGKA